MNSAVLDRSPSISYRYSMSKFLPQIGEQSSALVVAASNVAAITSALVAACPQPTRKDIHKLLAVQSYWLNEHGLALLHMSQQADVKSRRAIIEAGTRLVSESRKTMATLLTDPTFDKGEGKPPATGTD